MQSPRPPITVAALGPVAMRIAAAYADTWSSMSFLDAFDAQLEETRRRLDAMTGYCDAIGRDPATLEVSQQCLVVIAETDDAARAGLERAAKIYGGHMGGGLEAHGIWGTPPQVIDRIADQARLGCGLFVIEFFGRDTREPARLFAEQVMPAFRTAVA